MKENKTKLLQHNQIVKTKESTAGGRDHSIQNTKRQINNNLPAYWISSTLNADAAILTHTRAAALDNVRLTFIGWREHTRTVVMASTFTVTSAIAKIHFT